MDDVADVAVSLLEGTPKDLFATAAAIYSLGHELHTFTRSTQVNSALHPSGVA